MMSHDFLMQMAYSCCYRAGYFFLTARALTGYFEVTRQLTMKPFPAKISERTTLQNLWRLRVTAHCYSRMLTDRRPPLKRGFMNFQLENFQLCNKSLKDWSLVPGPCSCLGVHVVKDGQCIQSPSDNSNLPLTRSNFHFPSNRFLHNCTQSVTLTFFYFP